MKILHVTDIHFQSFVFDWIKEQHADYDVICLTGDFLDETCDTNIIDQITWIKDWLLSFKIPVFVCSGNHDIVDGSTDWFLGLPYKDGSITTIDGITFGCAPESCDDFFRYRNCDILLHHYPPFNDATAIDKSDKAEGSNELKVDLSLLKKCQYILCGHIHQPMKRQSTISRSNKPDLMICNAGGHHKPNQIQHLIIEI